MPQLPPASQPDPSRPRRWRRLAVRTAGAAVLLLIVAVGLVAEPFWLKPVVQRYVRNHAGRQIDFDGAQVRLDAAGRPVLRLRHVRIENAAWASPRPLIDAAAVAITFSWRSFSGGRTVLPLLVVEDGEIDLEQQPDGLRNWRIANPEDRGPGKVRVQALEAPRSRLHLVQRGRDLVLDLATRPLVAGESPAARAGTALTQTLDVQGSFRGTPFSGRFAVGTVFSLADSGVELPLRGTLTSGGASLALDGAVRDLLTLGALDVDAHALSPDLSGSVGPLFGNAALPALAADARARLQKDGPRWTVSGLEARLGRSDLAGGLKVDRQAESGRPLVSGALTTRHLHVDDLRRGLAGRGDAVIAVTPARSDRSRPRRLDGIDADIDLDVQRVSGLAADSRWASADDVKVHADLQNGRLTLAPLAFGYLGGTASGRLTVEPGEPPAQVSLDLVLKGLRLSRLAKPGSSAVGLQGGLDLGLKLRSRGDTLATLRDGVSGTVSGDLVRATLPASLAARLALDGGQWLRALASPGKQVPVTCSVGEMRIDAGRGLSTRLAIETDDVLVTGRAELDLRRKSYELVLTPHRKQAALLALDKSVRVAGNGTRPNVALVERAEPAGPAGCRGAAAR